MTERIVIPAPLVVIPARPVIPATFEANVSPRKGELRYAEGTKRWESMKPVIAAPDAAIQVVKDSLYGLDCRVKPDNDEER
jgi:hypothetical protein